MYPSLSITTLFHGNEFKNTTYNLPQDLLDKYDGSAITLHELVNELFEPWEQVDESQHSLLAIALQTATGGIPAPYIGMGIEVALNVGEDCERGIGHACTFNILFTYSKHL